MTTPAVRALYQENPQREIHYLTQKPSNQIFEFSPYISKTILYPSQEKVGDLLKLIKQLRNENYSTVIDFLGLPKTALLARLTGAKQRIGFNLRGRNLFYTDALDKSAGVHYSAAQKLGLLEALGIYSQDSQIDFFIGEQDREKARQIFEEVGVDPAKLLVTVSPVSRRDYKVWPAQHFAQLCDFLIEKYSAQILFLWGPGEEHFIEAVRQGMKHQALPNYDIPTIRQTVALFEQADLHIGNDNGPMHFAISTRMPTIAIFGRPQAKNWIPPHRAQHQAIEYDPGCKDSCTYPQCQLECIRGVQPSIVITAAQEQLERILSEGLKRDNLK